MDLFVTYDISQIVKLVSKIIVSNSGQLCLFEKCSCAHQVSISLSLCVTIIHCYVSLVVFGLSLQLLKSLMSLLDRLLDNVYHIRQWSKKQYVSVLLFNCLYFVCTPGICPCVYVYIACIYYICIYMCMHAFIYILDMYMYTHYVLCTCRCI